jgi:hypothetical protein
VVRHAHLLEPSPEPARYILAMGPRTYALIEAIHQPGAGDMAALFAAHDSVLVGALAQTTRDRPAPLGRGPYLARVTRAERPTVDRAGSTLAPYKPPFSRLGQVGLLGQREPARLGGAAGEAGTRQRAGDVAAGAVGGRRQLGALGGPAARRV